MKENIGVLVDAEPGPGILHKLTGVIAGHDANITSVDIIEEHQTYSRSMSATGRLCKDRKQSHGRTFFTD